MSVNLPLNLEAAGLESLAGLGGHCQRTGHDVRHRVFGGIVSRRTTTANGRPSAFLARGSTARLPTHTTWSAGSRMSCVGDAERLPLDDGR
jgi:hypothetical protein